MTAPSSPSNRSLSCDEFDALLPDYLDGMLDMANVAAADAHAAECVRCRRLRDDLAEIRADAARLPALTPSRDLWSGISARIETPTIEFGGAGVRTVARGTAWRLAAAAVVLVAATAGVTWSIATSRVPAVLADAPTSADPATETAVYRVAAAYDNEIAALRQLLAERSPSMDSATVRLVALNLQAIDDAIARLRGALDSLPSNALLSQQLVQAYDMKLNALRQVAALPTE